MVDALAPAVAAFSKAVAEGAAAPAALAALTDAADAGAHDTIEMQARKGRASYLGPRSVGHEDPGRGVVGADPARAARRRRPAGGMSGMSRHADETAGGTRARRSGFAVCRCRPGRRRAYCGSSPTASSATPASAATPEEVAAAFTAVAAERSALAERLRKAGRTSEAEIIAIGALIAGDPALSAPPWRRCRAARTSSPRCGRRPSARPS